MAAGKASGKTRKKKTRRPFSTIMLILMMLTAAAFLAILIIVDVIPKDMLLALIGVLAALLLVGGFLLFGSKKWMRALGVVISVFCIAVYGMGFYYLSSTYAMYTKISSNTEAAESENDVTEQAFNLYITGIDQWTKNKGMDLERSDVNMILTVSPKTRKILLTSIPRDAYVPLHRTGTMDKLTHTGIYGVDETLNTIEDWTGIHMDYYVKANFDACVKLVDAIGGIDIDNPTEFRSALNNHLYEKGKIHLKGRGALYYARERKAFEGEDQLRVKNQLRVVKAILDKTLTSTTILTSYGDIMEVLGEEVETNMPASDMQALVKMQLGYLKGWEIETQRMSGKYEMEIVASMDPSNKYQVLKVNEKEFNSCIDNIIKTMNPTQEEIDAVEQAMLEERKQDLFRDLFNRLTGRGGDTENEEEGNSEE